MRTSLLPGLLAALRRNLGRGQRDVALYELGLVFLPAAKNDTADVYSMEPYVYAQFITGIDHQTHFGRARNSWLTGTATWAFVALSQYILGIASDYDGLTIRPCIPSHWSGYSASREFRDAHYDIEVRGAGRIVSAKFDGKPLAPAADGRLCLPVLPAGARAKVEIDCGV